MSKTYMRFPDFKNKAVTLSYDDGVRQDKRLIQIMKKHGLKGTFNINAGLFSEKKDYESIGRMTKEEAVEIYGQADIEVAVHGYKHYSLGNIDEGLATNEVLTDRKELETLFGKVIKGMAYANGSYSDNVVEILRKCGISYSRTVIETESFNVPQDWLRLPTTCHHNNPRLMELAEKFVTPSGKTYFWANEPRLFYLWGHSYEFDDLNNWEVIEDFAEFMGNRQDVWYATNGEIYEYVQACERLQFNAEGTLVYNPSVIDVYLNFMGKQCIAYAGKTVCII